MAEDPKMTESSLKECALTSQGALPVSRSLITSSDGRGSPGDIPFPSPIRRRSSLGEKKRCGQPEHPQGSRVPQRRPNFGPHRPGSTQYLETPLPEASPKSRHASMKVVAHIQLGDYAFERQEFGNRSKLGCWYCGKKTCYLTHKHEGTEGALHPERNPHDGSNPYYRK